MFDKILSRLILLTIVVLTIGCELSALKRTREETNDIENRSGRVSVRTNEVEANQVLAWLLGGSVFLTSLSSTWYMYKRYKVVK